MNLNPHQMNHYRFLSALIMLLASACGALTEPQPTSAPFSQAELFTPAPVTQNTPPTLPPKVGTTSTLVDQMSDFDYFVLALSWSPDYCASNGQGDAQQCSIGRKLGFVLHGLWPQYDQGYPASCSTQTMPASLKKQYEGLYPNNSLFDHEWEKHGTCTGLSPADYLSLSKQIKESVIIPEPYQSPEKAFRTTVKDLVNAFVEANPASSQDDFEVFCSSSGRYLKELYACFTRSGGFTSCASDVQKDAAKSCQAADFVVRNSR